MSSAPRRRLVGVLAPIVPLLAVPVTAATIAVDSTFDDLDQGPNGNCTLREAIVAANTNAAVDACASGEPGPGVTDVVEVPAGTYVLTIAGAGEGQAMTGDLDLTDSVSVEGAGAPLTIVDGNGIDRVFDVSNVAAAISGFTIRGGDAGSGNGGGIRNAGTLTVEFSTLEGNSAGGPGGGVRNDNDIVLVSSTLAGNTTSDHGGGMDDHGTSLALNTTVSGNSVTGGGAGGGFYNLGGTAMTLIHVTFAGNTAGSGDALHNGGSTSASNLLIVGACDAAVATTDGGNLESPGDSCGLDAASDQVNVADPLLGPLADNGGPTFTHALLAGSPAIDAAEAAACPPTDQRGVARPFDGDGDGDAACDSGSFERAIPLTIFEDGFESGDTSAWSVVQS